MKIITVSREFGSGGREIGKRLADLLEMDYYDREILTAIAEKTSLSEDYIESTLSSGMIRSFPVTFGRTFAYSAGSTNAAALLAQQHRIIKEIAAKGRDFVVVGRSADVILADDKPFNLFVYADMEDRIRRCHERITERSVTDSELKKEIKRIDRSRRECHAIVSGTEWGDKSGYHLCVNTTGADIKALTPLIAAFARNYFGRTE